MLKTNLRLSCCDAAGLAGLLLTLNAAALAGSLDAPAAPTAAGSAMFTLQDLCNRLTSGTAGTQRSGAFAEPTAGPAATMCTLNQIMSAMPTVDAANGAGVADVLAGKTFWGLLSGGGWGLRTGTATAGGNVIGTDGSLSMTIPDGLYSGGKTATAVDADLTAANIKTGVNLFGTAGMFTNGATAVAGDILSGKTAYANGTLVTGTAAAGASVNGANGQLMINIPNGLYSGSETVTASDSNLVTANIKSGVTIFGVAGGAVVASGVATDGDVRSGVTYSNASGSSTGTLPTQTLSNANDTVSAGYYAATTLSAVDTDLVTANIKSGITIFGVAGDPNVVNTSSGDAVAADLATGKKAWVDGAEITGNSIPSATFSAPFPVARTGDATENGNNPKGATWPTPRFTDNINGTVTDNLTGLVWLKDANCVGLRTWANAMSWVLTLKGDNTMCTNTKLNDGSVAGQWRLPTIKELNSLINAGGFNPALPAGYPFTVVQSSAYWSSTTFAPNAGFALVVNLNDGLVSAGGKSNTRYVWPVRGGL